MFIGLYKRFIYYILCFLKVSIIFDLKIVQTDTSELVGERVKLQGGIVIWVSRSECWRIWRFLQNSIIGWMKLWDPVCCVSWERKLSSYFLIQIHGLIPSLIKYASLFTARNERRNYTARLNYFSIIQIYVF